MFSVRSGSNNSGSIAAGASSAPRMQANPPANQRRGQVRLGVGCGMVRSSQVSGGNGQSLAQPQRSSGGSGRSALPKRSSGNSGRHFRDSWKEDDDEIIQWYLKHIHIDQHSVVLNFFGDHWKPSGGSCEFYNSVREYVTHEMRSDKSIADSTKVDVSTIKIVRGFKFRNKRRRKTRNIPSHLSFKLIGEQHVHIGTVFEVKVTTDGLFLPRLIQTYILTMTNSPTYQL